MSPPGGLIEWAARKASVKSAVTSTTMGLDKAASGLGQIAQRLGIGKGSVHRALTALRL